LGILYLGFESQRGSGDVSSIFVITYETPQADPVRASLLYYWQPSQNTSSSAVETNQHFVPRFSQPKFSRFNYNSAASDTSSSAVETNVHTIGKFTPVVFQRGFLYNTAAFDFSSSAIETNIHFVGKFTQPQFSNLALLRQQQDWSTSGVVQPETNVHFIGKFTPVTFQRGFLYNTAAFDFSSSAVETNVHFLGKFVQPQFSIFPSFRLQDDWSSTVTPVQAETNTHFLGRYAPVVHKVLPQLRSNIAADFSSSAVETNAHVLGRFTPTQHNVLRALRETTAQDFGTVVVTQADGNVHFIPRFTQPQFNRFATLYKDNVMTENTAPVILSGQLPASSGTIVNAVLGKRIVVTTYVASVGTAGVLAFTSSSGPVTIASMNLAAGIPAVGAFVSIGWFQTAIGDSLLLALSGSAANAAGWIEYYYA
jgi:hypothetical protein